MDMNLIRKQLITSEGIMVNLKRLAMSTVLFFSVMGCHTSMAPWSQTTEGYHLSLAASIPSIVKPLAVKASDRHTTPTLPEGVLPLTLARRIAVSDNPDIHVAFARLERARARIAEAQARFLPTVSFSHTSARTFHTPASRNRLNTTLQPAQPVPTDVDTQSFAVTTLLNALRRPLFGQSSPKGNANSFSEHSSAFTVSWTVFDGYIREAQTQAAKHLSKAANYSLIDISRLILRSVDTAYYQVQLAREQVRISEADETFSRDQFEETSRLQSAGRATQADVDNFRIRMLTAQTNLAAAKGLRASGRVILAELMGIDGAIMPDLLMLSPLEEETDEEMSAPDTDGWLAQAMKNRPDLTQLFEVLESEDQNIKAVKGLYMPVLAVSGSWGFDRSSNLKYRVDDLSTAGAVELRWDLYTGGARRARVRQAQAARAQAQAQFRRLKLGIASEVRTASIDVTDAQEQIRLQRESLSTALENRRIIRVGYLAGKETLTRLNEAQRDYIEADANLTRARIRLRQAWSDLRAAASAYETAPETVPASGP